MIMEMLITMTILTSTVLDVPKEEEKGHVISFRRKDSPGEGLGHLLGIGEPADLIQPFRCSHVVPFFGHD